MSYQLALLGRALGMLKEHEFDNYYGHDDDSQCSTCFSLPCRTHKDDCKYAAVVRDLIAALHPTQGSNP